MLVLGVVFSLAAIGVLGSYTKRFLKQLEVVDNDLAAPIPEGAPGLAGIPREDAIVVAH